MAKYITAEIEVIELANEDVITASGRGEDFDTDKVPF